VTGAAGLVAWALAAGSAAPASWRALTTFARAALAGRTPALDAWLALGRPVALWLAVTAFAALLLTAAQRAATWRMFQAGVERRPGERGRPARPRAVGFAVGLVKLLVMSAALASLFDGSLPGLLESWQRDPRELPELSASVVRALLLRAAFALLVLGAADLVLQQLERLRRLRMTRRELRHEQREDSADPRMAAERRARARAGDPPEPLAGASLIITGGARVVALRYAPPRDHAPRLWRKGEGLLAVQLLAEAHALGLPLADDVVLANDLFRLEPGRAIPEAQHARVAALMVTQLPAESGDVVS
jgi:type III secretion system FlhB-like substrate exporter